MIFKKNIKKKLDQLKRKCKEKKRKKEKNEGKIKKKKLGSINIIVYLII